MTDFKDKNRKMLRLSWNFNHSFLSLFKNLLLLAILSYLALLKSYHMECIFFLIVLLYNIVSLKINNKEEKWFSSCKKLKIIFSLNLTRPGSGIRIQDPDQYWDFRLDLYPDPD